MGTALIGSSLKELVDKADELETLAEDIKLSTGYLYGLLQFTDMQAQVGKKPENALWHSWFAYRTKRLLERIPDLNDQDRQEWHNKLADKIATSGIKDYARAYKITLHTYLYKQR